MSRGTNEVVVCIPVRGGSRRIPRKNLLKLGDETLIARKVWQLLPIGKVVVASDDDEMLQEAESHGAIAVRRQCTNEGADSANDMIGEFMELIEPLHPVTVMWAHCTNPFLSTNTYANGLKTFRGALKDGYDSVVSVREVHAHLWSADRRTPLYNVTWCRNIRHLCANELPPYYEQDGGFFIQTYSQMRSNHYFFGEKPFLYKVPESEFCDINTPEDWEYAKVLYRKEKGKQ